MGERIMLVVIGGGGAMNCIFRDLVREGEGERLCVMLGR